MRLTPLSPVTDFRSLSESDLRLEPIAHPEDFLFSLGEDTIKVARENLLESDWAFDEAHAWTGVEGGWGEEGAVKACDLGFCIGLFAVGDAMEEVEGRHCWWSCCWCEYPQASAGCLGQGPRGLNTPAFRLGRGWRVCGWKCFWPWHRWRHCKVPRLDGRLYDEIIKVGMECSFNDWGSCGGRNWRRWTVVVLHGERHWSVVFWLLSAWGVGAEVIDDWGVEPSGDPGRAFLAHWPWTRLDPRLLSSLPRRAKPIVFHIKESIMLWSQSWTG